MASLLGGGELRFARNSIVLQLDQSERSKHIQEDNMEVRKKEKHVDIYLIQFSLYLINKHMNVFIYLLFM